MSRPARSSALIRAQRRMRQPPAGINAAAPDVAAVPSVAAETQADQSAPAMPRERPPPVTRGVKAEKRQPRPTRPIPRERSHEARQLSLPGLAPAVPPAVPAARPSPAEVNPPPSFAAQAKACFYACLPVPMRAHTTLVTENPRVWVIRIDSAVWLTWLRFRLFTLQKQLTAALGRDVPLLRIQQIIPGGDATTR